MSATLKDLDGQAVIQMGLIFLLIAGWSLAFYFFGMLQVSHDCRTLGEFRLGDTVYVCELEQLHE